MRTWLLAASGILALLAAPMTARADGTMGRLVYSFSYGSSDTTSARDSSTGVEEVGGQNNLTYIGNGSTQYTGSLNDKGTMTVDVLRQQSDGGLVVAISEQGENTRKAPPATCVVYGNTDVICDPNKTVYSEEYTLLRFLGSNFVDPNKLDANRHWAVAPSGSGVKADYTIVSNNAGVMQISETRSIRPLGGGSLTTDVQTKIAYDFNRTVPTSVDEYVTQRHDNGVVGTTTKIYQTTLNLVSDSVAKQ
jgi:hypothetical protein